jgi:hypothetical protein
VIARRERPHPGAQLSLFDTAEGFRHQIFITDHPDRDIAKLELRHRHRAHIENRIRAENSFGHPEQAFRATQSDSSRCRPSVLSSSQPDEPTDGESCETFRSLGSPVARPARSDKPVSGRMIRVDRMVRRSIAP